MLGPLSTAISITRTLGVGWVLYRLWDAAQQKTGFRRLRMPMRSWDAQPLSAWLQSGIPAEPTSYFAWWKNQTRPFFFNNVDRLSSALTLSSKLIKEADETLAGTWRYFGHQAVDVGFPPDWHWNPLRRQGAPADRHWSQIGDFDYGDIKLIWDPSRFTVTYVLVRAYAISGDERYPTAFWSLLADWAQHNSPQRGSNWKCGQEAAFRVMAWCFGLYGFAESSQTTPERVAQLAAMLAVHAERIESNIAYARSQKNNHAISEAVGLWTVGLLFPEFKRAERWRRLGRKFLEEEVRQQIYEDGSYIQHSTNYHRLMLHDLLWALRLGEVNGQRFSDEVYERVDRAVRFLYSFTDPQTGEAPNYGSNDGSLVLPLNNCGYTDFRPVLQAGHYLLHQEHLYPPGPWDEDLVWLFGPTALERKPAGKKAAACRSTNREGRSQPLSSKSYSEGGYYTLRGQHSWAMIRCAHYRDRPSQADQLHLDLWWRGINIACDAGSYLYNGNPPWDNGLARTMVHNTLTVDGRDQMSRAGRFLWLDWAQGKVCHQVCSNRGQLELWEGEHDGYRRLGVTHRRAVLRVGDAAWLIVDDVLGTGTHRARLHWLLADHECKLQEDVGRLLLHTPAGPFAVQVWCSHSAELSLVRGVAEQQVRGWRSRYYADKEPALSLAFEAHAPLPIRFLTILSAAPVSVKQLDAREVVVQNGNTTLTAQLSSFGTSPIIQQAGIDQAGQAEELTPLNQPRTHTLLIHQAFTSPAEAGGTRHFELAHQLVRQGQRFTIVASNLSYLTGRRIPGGKGLVTEQTLDGVRILRTYTYPSLHHSYVWRVVSFFSFAVTSVFAGLRAGRVDLVMGTTPPIFQAVSAWLVALLRRRPFLLEVRDLWPEFAIDLGVLSNPLLIALSRWLERFLYTRSTHIVVNSPAYQDYLIGKGVSAEKITLIPNGVDPGMFDPAAKGQAVREEFDLGKKFVVTYAGALGLANDLETVLRAADRLRDEPCIHFLIVGDGKERPRLEARASSLQLPNVTFVGARPKSQIHEFLAASDACVATLKDIPMFRTTYPNKVFDYMAAGRPTILAIDGVIRQVIEAAGGGLFVQPGDSIALAEAVKALSENRNRARAMGAAARVYVVEHFQRQRQAEAFAALVTSLTETAPVR